MLATLACTRYQTSMVPSNTIDIRSAGAVGDGITNNQAILERILGEIPADGKRILIPSGRYRTGAVTFPESVTLVFRNGGQLVIDEDAEVVIDGAIEAGIEQIFSGEGSVGGRPRNRMIYPQWFGARGDGVHNDAPAIQKAADLAAGSLGNTLFIPDGEYLFQDDLFFRSNIDSKGLFVKEIEIDEEQTTFSYFTFVPTHYARKNPTIHFVSDHPEIELDMEPFYGIQEGSFRLPVSRQVPLKDGSGTIDLMEGGTVRFYSSDFFSSRNNAKGDQYYDRNDISQLVSGGGEIFPELAFSYNRLPRAEAWSEERTYKKGDYAEQGGELFKAVWPSGPGLEFEDRYLGTAPIGPVAPEPGKATTQHRLRYPDGTEDNLVLWRRVETRVWYREKDRPLTVNGLRVEVRLVNHDGEPKRISGGVVNVNRSNMTFNHLELTVRDPDANFGRLLNSSGVVNIEFNNGYFSGATYHGLGYNILNSNVANIRYYNTVSVNSRKGLDGRHGKNITIQGGHFNVIDDHYGRNYVIRDVVLSGQSTWIPGYVTPEADYKAWHFETIRAFGFAGANFHAENITINQAGGRIPEDRTEMEQLYGALGGVLSVRSDIGDLYGRIVLRNITILENEGDVRVFNHTIEPTFDFAKKVRVPDRMIIEDIFLERPGNMLYEFGVGFGDGEYGPVEVRNTGPIGLIYSTSGSLSFSNCLFQDARFKVGKNSLVDIKDCTFRGENSGLDPVSIGSATGNRAAKDARIDFPLRYLNSELYRE